MTPALAAIESARAAGARLYLGPDGAPRIRGGNVTEDTKAELRAHRDDVTRILRNLDRGALLREGIARLSLATRSGKTVPAAMVQQWGATARRYAETGEGLSALRAIEDTIARSMGG